MHNHMHQIWDLLRILILHIYPPYSLKYYFLHRLKDPKRDPILQKSHSAQLHVKSNTYQTRNKNDELFFPLLKFLNMNENYM